MSKNTNLKTDKYKQMHDQQQLIEQKRRAIAEKLENKKKREAEEKIIKEKFEILQNSDKTTPTKNEETKKNFFLNDGSFMEQFKKLAGTAVKQDDANKAQTANPPPPSPQQDQKGGQAKSDDTPVKKVPALMDTIIPKPENFNRFNNSKSPRGRERDRDRNRDRDHDSYRRDSDDQDQSSPNFNQPQNNQPANFQNPPQNFNQNAPPPNFPPNFPPNAPPNNFQGPPNYPQNFPPNFQNNFPQGPPPNFQGGPPNFPPFPPGGPFPPGPPPPGQFPPGPFPPNFMPPNFMPQPPFPFQPPLPPFPGQPGLAPPPPPPPSNPAPVPPVSSTPPSNPAPVPAPVPPPGGFNPVPPRQSNFPDFKKESSPDWTANKIGSEESGNAETAPGCDDYQDSDYQSPHRSTEWIKREADDYDEDYDDDQADERLMKKIKNNYSGEKEGGMFEQDNSKNSFDNENRNNDQYDRDEYDKPNRGNGKQRNFDFDRRGKDMYDRQIKEEYDDYYDGEKYDEGSESYDDRSKKFNNRSKNYDDRSKNYDDRSKNYDDRSKNYDRSKSHDDGSKNYDDRSQSYDKNYDGPQIKQEWSEVKTESRFSVKTEPGYPVKMEQDVKMETDYKSFESNIKQEVKTEVKSESRGTKRRSRWGDAGEVSQDVKPPGVVDPQVLASASKNTPSIKVTGMSGALLSKVTKRDKGLLQYAMSAYGSNDLSDEDWKKCEDNYKIHLLYQDMMQKKAEVERLQAQGKQKYEYDSDEDIEGGTWEHKAREVEMVATKEWAQQLTEMAKGKHHIGDFLPPEELKKFMDKYTAVKGGGAEPDLSDYKEFKLTEDNKGFQMLQKLGWTEGKGLGADGSGIVEPVNKASSRDTNMGLGSERPDDLASGDDEYEAYRKRMMLAYRFRPNPLNNPRRPYY